MGTIWAVKTSDPTMATLAPIASIQKRGLPNNPDNGVTPEVRLRPEADSKAVGKIFEATAGGSLMNKLAITVTSKSTAIIR